MARLAPVAFDIETAGLDPDAVVTVVGLASEVGAWQGLNTAGRAADRRGLRAALRDRTGHHVDLEVVSEEPALLAALRTATAERLDGDRHYLAGFNGETWRGGFDLPFLRTACARHGAGWALPAMAYADVRSMVDRFNTGDAGDLVGVYDALVGGDHGDPFEDSREAVTAFEAGDWLGLLRHNLADLMRTYELAVLAGRYVPKSDFKMKNLAPPG